MMRGIRATVHTVSGSTVRNAEFKSRWSETVQVVLGKRAEAVSQANVLSIALEIRKQR